MITVVEMTRPIRASTGTVLRVAQTIRVADALESARVPDGLRRVAVRGMRSRLDHGLFAVLMALGCSVVGSEPMRSLTLGRPLDLRRSPAWASGRMGAALLIRLQVRADSDQTDVSVALGLSDGRHARCVIAWLGLTSARPLLRWCLAAWLASLDDRIGALSASRVSRPAPAAQS